MEKHFFFFKKVFGKKSRILPKNPKRDPLGLLNVFSQTENFKKFKGVPFDKIQKFSEKCRIVLKNRKGGPFGLPSTFGSIKMCGLVRDSNPRFPVSQTPENPGLTSRPRS